MVSKFNDRRGWRVGKLAPAALLGLLALSGCVAYPAYGYYGPAYGGYYGGGYAAPAVVVAGGGWGRGYGHWGRR